MIDTRDGRKRNTRMRVRRHVPPGLGGMKKQAAATDSRHNPVGRLGSNRGAFGRAF
jgi:hypothetical protein